VPRAPRPLEAVTFTQPVSPKTFLRMCGFAIPFSYVGIATVIAMIPSLAKTLGLSTAQAGLFCSIWMFARMGTFRRFMAVDRLALSLSLAAGRLPWTDGQF